MMVQGQRQVVLLLGAPGAGKGTQARFISETLGVPHLSSGDLLREHRRRGTDLGRAAQGYMDRGDLVPDELVIDMVMERLGRFDAARGALLDGFPRTKAQAETLDARLAEAGGGVRAAIYLDVPKKVLVERLAGRWICPNCQATYHDRFSRPEVEGVCDLCGSSLTQRPDDRSEVVENRVDIYLRETLPVIEHYAARGLVHKVDGNRRVDKVRAQICSVLGGVIHGQRRDRWHLYIKHEPRIGENGTSRWLGRTLCGKFIAQLPARQIGAIEQFEARPCRECEHILRPHQQPIPTTPVRSEELASSA